MSQAPKRTPAMGFIMAAVLIDMISIGLMVPVLPHIVGTFTHYAFDAFNLARLEAGVFAWNPASARVLGFNYDTGERYLSVDGFLPQN